MDKDRAIITQVSAKISADLVDKSAGTAEKLGEFALLFDSINNIMMETIYGAQAEATAIEQNNYIIEKVKEELGATEVVTSGSAPFTGVKIVGKQHGPIPEWLIKACKRDGVTKVYDNRDGLEANPKRPSFKAVDAEKAYWPPRAK
jgi:hypothetical protein